MKTMNTSKKQIIKINFTSYTGNSLSVLVSDGDGNRHYNHLEFKVTDKPLYQFGLYEFRELACMLSGYLGLNLSKPQISWLTARLFEAAQNFIIDGK